MSQTPPDDPFVPPPPPANSPYPPEVLATKSMSAVSDAKTSLILSIVGFFFFGFIFGFLAFRMANRALKTIDVYRVAQDKRGFAQTAKVLSIVDITLWGVGLIVRVFFLG